MRPLLLTSLFALAMLALFVFVAGCMPDCQHVDPVTWELPTLCRRDWGPVYSTPGTPTQATMNRDAARHAPLGTVVPNAYGLGVGMDQAGRPVYQVVPQ
jgi:hypothetical protein